MLRFGTKSQSFALTKKTHITIVVSDTKGRRACDKGDDREEYATAAAREKSHVLEGFFGEASRKVALEPERRRAMLQERGSRRSKRSRLIPVSGSDPGRDHRVINEGGTAYDAPFADESAKGVCARISRAGKRTQTTACLQGGSLGAIYGEQRERAMQSIASLLIREGADGSHQQTTACLQGVSWKNGGDNHE